jgi:hypothetical protein
LAHAVAHPWQNQRRFPPPWRADKIPGGCVVRDASGQAIAYTYSRANTTDALQAKMLTKDEARRIAINIAEPAGSRRPQRKAPPLSGGASHQAKTDRRT